MKKNKANKIYDILVMDGGAKPSNRNSFVRNTMSADNYFDWWFGGNLGLGGMLHIGCGWIYVTCYSEDLNPERQAIIHLINSKLEAV